VLPKIDSGDTLTVYIKSGEKTPFGKVLPFLGLLGGITSTVGKVPVLGDTVEEVGGTTGLLFVGILIIILLVILVIIGIVALLRKGKKDTTPTQPQIPQQQLNARISSKEDYFKLKNMGGIFGFFNRGE